MNLKSFRSQNPEYDNKTDDELAPALYKKYGNGKKQEKFYAEIGYEKKTLGSVSTLSQFRETYPEYNNKTDEDLSGALYKKYGSEMPQDEFNEAIGYKKIPLFTKFKKLIPDIDLPKPTGNLKKLKKTWYYKTKEREDLVIKNIGGTIKKLQDLGYSDPKAMRNVTVGQILKPFKTEEEHQAILKGLESSGAYPEVFKNFGSSMLAMPASGLVGMANMRIEDFKKGGVYGIPKNIAKTAGLPYSIAYDLMVGDPDIVTAGKEGVEFSNEMLTYKVKGREAEQLSEMVYVPFQKLKEWSQHAGEYWESEYVKAAVNSGQSEEEARKTGALIGATVETTGMFTPALIVPMKKAGMGQLLKNAPKHMKSNPGAIPTESVESVALRKQLSKRYPTDPTKPPPLPEQKPYTGLPLKKSPYDKPIKKAETIELKYQAGAKKKKSGVIIEDTPGGGVLERIGGKLRRKEVPTTIEVTLQAGSEAVVMDLKPGTVRQTIKAIKKTTPKAFIRKVKSKPDPEAGIPKTSDTTFYGGVPLNKIAKSWENLVGKAMGKWADGDLIPTNAQKLVDLLPGGVGTTLNRAMNYTYRSNLKNTSRFLKDMDAKNHFQSMGREYAIDLANRMQAHSKESQFKIGEYLTADKATKAKIAKKMHPNELALSNEAVQMFIDLGKQAVDVELLSEAKFFENIGQYMPRLYTSKEFGALKTTHGVSKKNRIKGSRFKKRQDLSEAVRTEMGEFLTPGYPVARGISQLVYDIEQARYFKGISQNPDWALVKKQQYKADGTPNWWTKEWFDPLTGKKKTTKGPVKRFETPPDTLPKGWIEMEESKQLGALSEAWVHPEIALELKSMLKEVKGINKYWRKGLGAWKIGKVVLSPKTHARNMFSNSLLSHLKGLPLPMQPIYLTKAMRAIRNKDSYYYKIAKDKTSLLDRSQTWTENEIGKVMGKDVEAQIKGASVASLPERFGKIGTIWEKGGEGVNWASKMYQAEEVWFKMSKFIHNMERRKMGVTEAAADAQKSLFDYSKITRAQRAYKDNPLGAPFATFSFKAMPVMTESLIKQPWRWALPSYLLYKLQDEARARVGATWEEMSARRDLVPDWMGGTSKEPNQMMADVNKAVSRFAITAVPVLDKKGRQYYWNAGNWTPWGGVSDLVSSSGPFSPLTQPGVSTMAKFLMNKNPFFDSKVIDERELIGLSQGEQYIDEMKEYGAQAFQDLAPTMILDLIKGIQSYKNLPDHRGRKRPLSIVMADVLAGVKIYPVDFAEQVTRLKNQLDPNNGTYRNHAVNKLRNLEAKKHFMIEEGVELDSAEMKDIDKKIDKRLRQIIGIGELAKRFAKNVKKSGLFKDSEVAR